MTQSSLFTIITITLNNLNGLKNTAASIHAQTNQDLEWIIIDGGSNDDTPEWLKKTNALWISKKDNGIYNAMNKGLKLANGKYILFLNAGDTLAAPDTLAELAEAIYTCSIVPDFIYGDALEALTTKECLYKPARPFSKPALGMFTHHQSMLYRREALTDMHYDEKYKIAADYDLTVRFLKNKDKILYLPVPLCIFESGGISQQNAQLGRKEQMQIRKENKISNTFTNAMIYTIQNLMWKIRQIAPNFYWRIKSKK
ncbi:MAG: glycosyltransferase [Alphaproteobacteria bacterium]|nr:glycosyltransferase [Alphaproteobacteria bacterium]